MRDARRHLTEGELRRLAEGSHRRIWERLGAHPGVVDGVPGSWFAVWAPRAERVAVVGDFNGWKEAAKPLYRLGGSGFWEAFAPAAAPGVRYRFAVAPATPPFAGERLDPVGFACDVGATASVVWDHGAYRWQDGDRRRAAHNGARPRSPESIYQLDLASWMRDDAGRPLGCRELAPRLAEHVAAMGFTHVELLPVAERGAGGPGGAALSFFAPAAGLGSPDDLKLVVDTLHGAGIGVFLGWPPARFAAHRHGLGRFDGAPLYEPPEGVGEHGEEGLPFELRRAEVVDFLISSALFWLELYHLDGLRVAGVPELLAGDGAPRDAEDLQAAAFLTRLNQAVENHSPRARTFAEEPTSWPAVSQPVRLGGLGFDAAWSPCWAQDILDYLSEDPLFRKHHHGRVAAGPSSASGDGAVLALSHREVAPGTSSLLGRMPGDTWQKLANLRLLYGWMHTHPGSKLLFMGGELGQWSPWQPEGSLQWHLLEDPAHRGVLRWVRDLNTALRGEPALFERDGEPGGFEWVDRSDAERSVLAWLRHAHEPGEDLLCVANFTPLARHNYRVGVPHGGIWREILNGDATLYGGSGVGNLGGAEAAPVAAHGRYSSLNLVLPPLALVVFRAA